MKVYFYFLVDGSILLLEQHILFSNHITALLGLCMDNRFAFHRSIVCKISDQDGDIIPTAHSTGFREPAVQACCYCICTGLLDHVKVVYTCFLKRLCVLVAVCKTVCRQHQHIRQTGEFISASNCGYSFFPRVDFAE